MKIKLTWVAAFLALAACCAFNNVQAENATAVSEVLKLKNAGVTDETIVSYIQSRNINYDLSADNILALREKGISSAVLNAMITSGNAGSGSSTQPPSVWAQPQQAIPQSPQVMQPAPNPPVVDQPQPAPIQPAPVYNVVQSPQVLPPVANPDVAYFYQELSPYGRWMLAEDGQWCWQPTVVVGSPDWRPYWDKGHWIWTDHGWYWSSDYPWGWAAFHYGRWQLHPHHGWVWYPDHVWGPSWVVWRGDAHYCGWAPLPPGSVYDTAHGYFLYHGSHVEAGFDFGLSYAHFSFCLTTQMGHPMQPHAWNEAEARMAFNKTTIVNNYTVQHTVIGGVTHVQVVNHGIDSVKPSASNGRPLEPVHIEDLRTPAPGRAHEHMDAQSGTLHVYRPKFSDHQQSHGEKGKENPRGGN